MAELTVADIMHSDVPTVGPEDSLETVVRTLRDHEMPGVPVVDSGGRLKGIITESDLVFSEDDHDIHLPHYIDLFGGIVFLESFRHFERRLRKAHAMTARDLMTERVVTISPHEPVRRAGRLIAASKHNRLPVVDRDGYLVGVVTRLDVLDALTREA